MLEDPEAASVFDSAWESYKTLREKQKPQIDPSLQPLYEKVSTLEALANRFTEREKEDAERPQREFQQKWNSWQNDSENERFYLRLKSEKPELFNEDSQGGVPMMTYMAQLAANNNFAPLSKVWKENAWRFDRNAARELTPAAPPPKSLVAGDGEPGFPGATPAGGAKGENPQAEMRDRIIQLERARRSFGVRTA